MYLHPNFDSNVKLFWATAMSPTAPALNSNKTTNGRRESFKIAIRMHEVHELLLLPWQVHKQFPPSSQHKTAGRKLRTRSRDATLETALTINIADLLLNYDSELR